MMISTPNQAGLSLPPLITAGPNYKKTTGIDGHHVGDAVDAFQPVHGDIPLGIWTRDGKEKRNLLFGPRIPDPRLLFAVGPRCRRSVPEKKSSPLLIAALQRW